VEGVLLTPMNEPRDLAELVDWSEFSVVSATPSVVQPLFHAVSPNHYDNMMKLCAGLSDLGYRRIGLAMPADRDERVHHRWTGALAWHQRFGRIGSVAPLLDHSSRTGMDEATLDRWLRRKRPDVVVTDLVERDVADAVRRVFPAANRPPVVGMNWHKAEAGAGIDQQVESLASIAIELVARMIQHGERGVPATPHTTLIDGKWMRGGLRRV
jgi:LacI family transcriptional regulator